MTIKEITRQKITEFQERNCRGCDYAVEALIGTGRGCCTGTPKMENGVCLNKKTSKPKPA